MPAWANRVTTKTQDISTMNEIRLAQRQRQRDQEIEQHRYFELIGEAIADLGDAGRVFRLVGRDVLHTGFPRLGFRYGP